MTRAERFWSKVDTSGQCWQWTAGMCGPYGRFRDDNGPVPAHRFAYEQARGPIPAGLTIDHLCANKRCVRPEHLEAVTSVENVRRYNEAHHQARAALALGGDPLRPGPLVAARVVAERLGVSKATLRRLIVSGELPAHRVGRLFRLDPVAVEQYIAAENNRERVMDL
jgi:excisionase family DNA binding protein